MSDMSPATDFHFDLPPELIAQDPPARRGDSRLLLVDPQAGVAGERPFRGLGECLRAGDLLVVNESRVLPARLLTVREDTGGKVEILLIRPEAAKREWLALARPGRRLRQGTRLGVVKPGQDPDPAGPVLEIRERLDQGQVRVTSEEDPGILAEKWGVPPLPPYIKREPEDQVSERGRRDRDRYQTVYAVPDGSGAGSVAAPTAGLHFSAATLEDLKTRGIDTARVSLHVGPGTFREPTEEQFAARRLHDEFFNLPVETARRIAQARRDGGRVIAVGTTSLRVLETVGRLDLPGLGPEKLTFGEDSEAGAPEFSGEAIRQGGHWMVRGRTRLFMRPPDQVVSVDGLITNFHLPGSSLLMLVASLVGENIWRSVYTYAVAQRMRFFSYGDCMLILSDLAE